MKLRGMISMRKPRTRQMILCVRKIERKKPSQCSQKWVLILNFAMGPSKRGLSHSRAISVSFIASTHKTCVNRIRIHSRSLFFARLKVYAQFGGRTQFSRKERPSQHQIYALFEICFKSFSKYFECFLTK